jgi:lysophospholipase L1-like esterase
MKQFRRFLLVLLLAVLASWSAPAQETNHNFARWEKEISAYERGDATNPPPPHGVVFIGSSTIARWQTLAQDFPGLPVVNRGFGGSGIVDATHFAGRIVFPYQPKLVLLRAGGNDLWAGKPVAEVFADYHEFVVVVHAKLPDAKIIFISLSPSLARWKQHEQEKQLNELVAGDSADKPWLQYVETYDLPLGTNGLPRQELFVADGLHFNGAGYRLLAERVRPCLPK